MSITAEVFYVTDVLDAGDAAFGVLGTCWALGMVVGAVGLAAARAGRPRWPSPRSPRSRSRALGLATAAAGGVLWAAFAGFTLGGVAHGLKNVLLRTLIHERVPETLRGRAFALYNAARNGAELSALALGGVLVGAIGAQAALLLSGADPARDRLAGPCCSSRPPPGGPHMPTKAETAIAGSRDRRPAADLGRLRQARPPGARHHARSASRSWTCRPTTRPARTTSPTPGSRSCTSRCAAAARSWPASAAAARPRAPRARRRGRRPRAHERPGGPARAVRRRRAGRALRGAGVDRLRRARAVPVDFTLILDDRPGELARLGLSPGRGGREHRRPGGVHRRGPRRDPRARGR